METEAAGLVTFSLMSRQGGDRWHLICARCGRGRVRSAVEVSWRRVRLLPALGEVWQVDGSDAALAAAVEHEREHAAEGGAPDGEGTRP